MINPLGFSLEQVRCRRPISHQDHDRPIDAVSDYLPMKGQTIAVRGRETWLSTPSSSESGPERFHPATVPPGW